MTPILSLKKTYHFGKSLLAKALPAAVFTGFPGYHLHIYGITGTDGKTTSSTLLYHTLKTAGYKVALISTVAAFIGDEEIDTGFHVTSPEHWQVQQLLQRCVQEGIEHIVLEVTSHGIFQYRTWGIPFELAGITNITNEHMDYFVNYQDYLNVKAELLLKAKQAVIPAQDVSTPFLRKIGKSHNKTWAEYKAEPPNDALGETIRHRFPEKYNQANAQLVRKMADLIGISDEVIAKAIRTFPGIKGRMQEIPNKLGLKIIVDFAHTPNALEGVLSSLRKQTGKNLWAVYGAAGLRDRTKRAPMGEIGTRIADMAIFTAEDPRSEKLQVILRQMKEGVAEPNFRKVMTIPDRHEAITYALKNAKRGDIVAVLGKGHEQSMNFGQGEVEWSDEKVVKEILKTL